MNVTIAKSPIHGRGVFANDDIEEGHWQFVYGDLRSVLPGDPIERYGIEQDDGYTFIPYAPWCCVNHSFTPNCEIQEDEDRQGQPLICIVALQDIPFGEELTIDYGHDPSTY